MFWYLHSLCYLVWKEASPKHLVRFYQHYLASLFFSPKISILQYINLLYNYSPKIPHGIMAILRYQQVGNLEVYNINFHLLNCNLFRRLLWKTILCASLTFHQGISKWFIRQRCSLGKFCLERKWFAKIEHKMQRTGKHKLVKTFVPWGEKDWRDNKWIYFHLGQYFSRGFCLKHSKILISAAGRLLIIIRKFWALCLCFITFIVLQHLNFFQACVTLKSAGFLWFILPKDLPSVQNINLDEFWLDSPAAGGFRL